MALQRDTTHSEEETTKLADGNTAQTISRNTTSSPTQTAQTIATSTVGPTGSTEKIERTSGASHGAAREYGQKKTLFHAYQIIWYIFGFVEIVLAFRFVLKLLGASPTAGFTKFVYGLSTPFAGPFSGIFQSSTNTGVETTSFIEWSTVIAAIVYIVVAWGLIKIFQLGKPTDPGDVSAAVDTR